MEEEDDIEEWFEQKHRQWKREEELEKWVDEKVSGEKKNTFIPLLASIFCSAG